MKPEEFNHIIIPMRASLEQLARKMTGDDSRAEDLVQEVMLKMWSIRDTLERYDSKEALAVAILKNKARDLWRHDKMEQGTAADDGEAAIEDLETEHADEVELIRRIVKHLPPLQQKLFRMKEIEGYDSREIMQITGCIVFRIVGIERIGQIMFGPLRIGSFQVVVPVRIDRFVEIAYGRFVSFHRIDRTGIAYAGHFYFARIRQCQAFIKRRGAERISLDTC